MMSQRAATRTRGPFPKKTTSMSVRASATHAAPAAVPDASRRNHAKPATVCIVGAGPAGALAAAAFARRGMDVQVFEQRDQQSVMSATSRTFAIILTPRGVHAIKESGITPGVISPNAVQLTSLIRQHRVVPTRQALAFTKPGDAAYAMERQDLLSSMLEAAEQLPPDAGHIQWHWGYKLADVDLNTRHATFKPCSGDDGGQKTLEYDLLVGTDGAGSGVRGALEKNVPGFKTKLVYKSSVTWFKTFAGVDISELKDNDPALPGLASAPPMGCFGNIACKVYKAGKLPPILTCWKGRDGKLAGSLALCPSFDEDFLKDQLSAALDGMPHVIVDRIVAQLTQDSRPASSSNTVMQVSQMHGPHCVILGDAAHPVTATLGQGRCNGTESTERPQRHEDLGELTLKGCNAALESVSVLLKTWDHVKDLDKLPEAFNAARLHDAHALQTVDRLQLMAGRPSDFPQSSPLVLAGAKAVIRTSSALQAWLHKTMPSRFHHVNPLVRVADDALSYSKVLRLLLLQAGAVIGAAVAPLLLLLAWGVYAMAA